MADFGYDVADYCDIDPVFGDLRAAEDLIVEAHDRGLKVILDWVPNHSSNQHRWFTESRSSRTNPKRDWYVWRDAAPDGGPPNNWIRAWSNEPAWTFDEATQQWYLHCFLPEQPDLNWANPHLEDAMHEVLRFWLDRGVDGFRMDVIHLIGKDPDLGDDPPELAALSHVPLNHRLETHPLLRRIRHTIDSYPGERMAIGEVYLLDTTQVVSYLGSGDELQLVFNFPPLYARWDAAKWRRQIEIAEAAHTARDASPTWVLSNHDNQRHRSRYGTEARARAAAVLLMSLRGTAFLYAGEELGLQDAEISPERAVDPGGRDGCRAPIPWDRDQRHGWPTTDPWLPWPPDADRLNMEAQREDPSSMLHLYRRMLSIRSASIAMQHGSLELLDELPDGVIGYRRTLSSDVRIIVINFTSDIKTVGHLGCQSTRIEISSSLGRRAGEPFDQHLYADEALVLIPH